ncbi:MAG: hypothetical protein ACYCZX_18685, partial [Rhodospirillaceae bacterium]
ALCLPPESVPGHPMREEIASVRAVTAKIAAGYDLVPYNPQGIGSPGLDRRMFSDSRRFIGIPRHRPISMSSTWAAGGSQLRRAGEGPSCRDRCVPRGLRRGCRRMRPPLGARGIAFWDPATGCNVVVVNPQTALALDMLVGGPRAWQALEAAITEQPAGGVQIPAVRNDFLSLWQNGLLTPFPASLK